MDNPETYIDGVLKDEKPEKEPNLNALQQIGKGKQKTESVFKGILKFLWDLKLLILIQLFALLMIGLDKFLTATWTWAVFKDPEFWNSYLLYFIANWFVVIGWIIRRFTVLKKSNQKYTENLNHIQEKIDIDYDNPFIEEQAHLEDTARKIEIFNNEIYVQLYNLSVKHHIRDLNYFYANYDSYTTEALKSFKWPKKGAKRAEYKRAYNKILDLKEKLKKSWQKENIGTQKLNYPHVTRSLIASGLKPNGKYYRFNSYEPKVFSTTLKAIAPSSFTSSVIGLIILSFQFLKKQAELADYLLFFSQIFLIAMNVILILSTLDSIFDRTYLKSTDESRADIEKFFRRHTLGTENYNDKEKRAYEVIKYQEETTV